MKTLIICALFISIHFNGLALLTKPLDNRGELPSGAIWVKSETGVWFGDYKTWYKIDRSSVEAKMNNTIKVSYNKKKWIASDIVAWQDKEGKSYFISNNRLLCTSDNKHWVEVPDKTWLGVDNIWYRFDSNWDLWEVKQ